jgi:hypothetical protein
LCKTLNASTHLLTNTMALVSSAQPPKITKDTLLITTWVLFGSSSAFFLSRLAIRIKFTGKVWADDWLAAAALACLLADALIITFMADAMYETLELSNMAAAAASPKSSLNRRASFYVTVSFYMRMQFAETIMFWTCLWLVKASFLAFFHRLTNNLRKYIIAWWTITAFTAVSYLASMITYPVSCSSFAPCKYITHPLFSLSLSLSLSLTHTTSLSA